MPSPQRRGQRGATQADILCRSPEAALTQLPLQLGKAAEGGGDEVAILVLHVFQDVFPVQADGIGDEERAVQVCQQPETQEHHPAFTAKVSQRKAGLNRIYTRFCRRMIRNSHKRLYSISDILLCFLG